MIVSTQDFLFYWEKRTGPVSGFRNQSNYWILLVFDDTGSV